MLLTRLIIVRIDELVYSLAHHNNRLIYFLVDDYTQVATEAVLMAKVTRVNHKSRTAFIECLGGMSGFINLDYPRRAIQDGSNLLVQLVWHGDDRKQAKFRSGIQLAGKYAVYTGEGALSVSSKKLSSAGISQIKESLSHLGSKWVLRSCVNDQTDLKLVIEEMELLSTGYSDSSAANQSRQHYDGVRNYLKLLRSLPLADGCEIITNDQDIYTEIMSKQNLWQIDIISFDPQLDYAVMIDECRQQTGNSRLELDNRANLEFATLNGIHVIDINAGNADLAIDKLNFAVIDEIYRQICLRNMQGIILIDFIKNMHETDEERLITRLRKLFNHDVTSTKVLGFSHTGLCEIIRNKF